MKFKHTKRNGVLFVFLSIITISIYSLVVLHHVRKEVASMAAEREGEKKPANYIVMWILGWITLGIVPLIWYCKVADRVAKYAKEAEIESPRVDFEVMFNWTVFGCLIIVGPFIAWTKFFKLLNALEDKLNETALKEEVVEEAPAEELPAAIEEEAFPVAITEEVEGEANEEEKEVKVICKESASNGNSKWRVRYSNSPKAIVEFNNKEDAIEYAKYLASRRSHKVTVITRRK